MTPPEVTAALDRAFREERTAILATLAGQVGGDLALAEDAVQDAFVAAGDAWVRNGVPDRPGAWLTTTARRRAIDRLRRDQTRSSKLAALAHLRDLDALDQGTPEDEVTDMDDAPPEPDAGIDDDRLRLIFTCCHPALSMEARVALTLKTICGLDVDEVARAFLTTETTMYQRLVRAKRKITAAGIPYRVPARDDLPERIAGVARVLLLIFNEGHTTTSDVQVVRADLCDESIRLARLLGALLPDDAEVAGLLALLLLTDARRAARLDEAGALVSLDEQARDRWDHDQIDEGLAVLDAAIRRDRPGPYQVQASIAAVHARAPSTADTDWVHIAALYAMLEHLDPSPVVRINRAVAVAEADGPLAGLRLLGSVADDPRLARYVPLHAAVAELRHRTGDLDGARASWARAVEVATNPAERAALARRAASVAPGSG